MKKIYSIIVILAAISITACGGDDDEIDNGGNASDKYYIEVKLDGRTYNEAIPDWICAQINPIGTDSHNKKLVYTYDMVAHFENNGFVFMFGIVHYKNKEDLLASNPGSYLCARNILDKNIYNNLTFCPLFEIDGDEYDLESGTHQVKSIKSIGNKVCIEGSFTNVFKLKGDVRNISGSYRIYIP